MRQAPRQVQLYRTILPALERDLRENRTEEIDGHFLDPADLMSELNQCQIFDSRQLPVDLVLDTGMATRHESSQIKKTVRLPYPDCYFEWSNGYLDVACVAAEVLVTENTDGIIQEWIPEANILPYADDTKALGTVIEFRAWMIHEAVMAKAGSSLDVLEHYPVHGRFLNGVHHDKACENFTDVTDDDPFLAFYNVYLGEIPGKPEIERRKARETALNMGAICLLGTLTLLEEKLLLNTFVPDPSPRLTAKREKSGRSRLTGPSNVLRVDVPAVHRIARPHLSGHESPMLHWRRGHWRVLHRGSEFEDKTWVRKCLVGDPSKGFLSKEYRLTAPSSLMPPVINPPPPILLGA